MKIKNLPLIYPVIFLLLTFVGSAFTSNENSDSILGTWIVGSKSGHVQIYKQGSRYYGKITWLKQPNSPKTGKPLLDGQNPNPEKRKEPILGLVNLKDFTYSKKGIWENGKVYDQESGKEYSCKITMKDANTVEVRGYIGISLIGRTDVWQRVK